MKIMMTKHISEKCVFSLVNNKTPSLEDVTPEQNYHLVLSVCFVSNWKWGISN